MMVLLGLHCQTSVMAGEKIKWVAAELPPFVWQQNNTPHGYAYELMAAMSVELGRTPDLTFYPWARAVKIASEGHSYGIFPLARTPDREHHYKWLIPITTVKYTFFGRQPALPGKTSIEHASLEQLSQLRIGLLRGSPVAQYLQAKNFRHIVYEKSYQDLLKMLALGGIDAIYAGYPMLTAAIEEYGFRFEDVCTGPSLGSAELYLAASIGLDEEEEQTWKHAYEALLKNGTVSRLQNKYWPVN